MKVAIIHDWLTVSGGAEKVLAEMIACFPQADIFTVVDFLPETFRDFLQGKSVQTTFIQRLPFARKHYRAFLPLMPFAIEQIDLSGYDLVLSASHAVAKGVLTGPDQLHVSYIYSPMRYAWDLQHQYLETAGLKGVRGWLARALLHRMRIWDYVSAARIDHVVASSKYIARRVHKVWRRESELIYPPVDASGFTMSDEKEDFYLTASRFVPYKRIDLIVESFTQMPEKKLVVIGDGPEFKHVQAKAAAFSNIELKGYLPTDELKQYLRRAQAFVFAAEEDFGILPLEAQASGTPVIAFGRGGALETVRGLDQADPTGIFFYEQTVDAICAAVKLFEQEKHRFTRTAFQQQVARFSPESFRMAMKKMIAEKMSTFFHSDSEGA